MYIYYNIYNLKLRALTLYDSYQLLVQFVGFIYRLVSYANLWFSQYRFCDRYEMCNLLMLLFCFNIISFYSVVNKKSIIIFLCI